MYLAKISNRTYSIIMKKISLIILSLCNVFILNATDYLVSTNYTLGAETEYHQRIFKAGSTHFQTLQEVLNIATEGDNIFLAPGTYADNITLSVNNISIYGNNSWKDVRSNTRNTSNESIITGTITINANNITLNGLKFTGTGRVVNTSAANGSPIKNISLEYNLVEESTLGSSTAVFTFGKVYNNTDAKANVSQLRYENINISHNDFNGSKATNFCPFIIIGGGYGNITIHDNKFTDGGNSIEVGNSRGNIKITNNKFQEVGKSLYNASAATNARGGAFCVYLNRNSLAGTTNIDVSHNGFNKCTGRQTLYALIRYYQGDKNNTETYIAPVGTTAKINHNVFLSKTTYTDDDYNYVLYCNKDYMGDVTVDARYNYFDNSDMCLAHIKMPGKTAQERFYSSSFGFYDFRESQNVSYEQVLKGWENARSARVAQSFDISEYDFDDNGNPYYYFNHIQNQSVANNLSTYGCVEAQLITRVYNANTSTEKRAHVDAIHAGHGSNMVIFRHEDKNWVCCGGYGALNSTGESCLSNGITIFPYHSANLKADNPSLVDCSGSKTSFVDINKKTRPIYNFKTDNEKKSSSWYGHCPAIDETSRYLAVLSRKKGGPMCVEVYHFDEILDHLINGADRPKLINTFQIAKGADAYSGISGDQGFWTWDHQGFTISGDYIYFMEGCGIEHEASIDKKPTVIFHAYNWRTGKSHLRRQVKASVIMSMSHGEPEGIKIRRAANGRPYMYLNIANGPGGDRNVNLIRYNNLYKEAGLPYGVKLPLSKGKSTPDATSLSFSTATSETKTIKLTNDYLKGDLSATIAGDNAEFFSISTKDINALSNSSTITITYNPVNPTTETHNAVLRISSTYADDVLVPLSATYTGEVITGIERVRVDENYETTTKYYNLHGIEIQNPSNGIYIKQEGNKTSKVIIK